MPARPEWKAEKEWNYRPTETRINKDQQIQIRGYADILVWCLDIYYPTRVDSPQNMYKYTMTIHAY